MDTAPIVSFRGITVRRPGVVVLRSIDLTVQPGEAVAVFGANGSGKTTLLRVAATLLPTAAGTGSILGARLGSPQLEEIRPRIGLVGHEPALYPHLTLGENLELFSTLARGEEGRGAAAAALAMVGLEGASGRRAASASNGMKRRAEFARLAVIQPLLLLLDEAHVGLDPAAWELVGHLVEDVTGRGGGALVVSHERDRVRPLVHRSVEIVDGALREPSP